MKRFNGLSDALNLINLNIIYLNMNEYIIR